MTTLIDLTKKAKISLEKKSLVDVVAKVALVLDVSKSMNPLYKNGTVQKTIERVLALAINFDPDKQVDAYVFGTEASQLEPVTVDDLSGYVEREIIAKHKINQATKYAKAIECVQKTYFGKRSVPVFVIFITDGDASDKPHTKAWLQQVCREPLFFQFVGIGKEKFVFLEKLDDLEGRVIDSTGYIKIDDLANITEIELYDRLLGEFPDWLKVVKKKGIKPQLL